MSAALQDVSKLAAWTRGQGLGVGGAGGCELHRLRDTQPAPGVRRVPQIERSRRWIGRAKAQRGSRYRDGVGGEPGGDPRLCDHAHKLRGRRTDQDRGTARPELCATRAAAISRRQGVGRHGGPAVDEGLQPDLASLGVHRGGDEAGALLTCRQRFQRADADTGNAEGQGQSLGEGQAGLAGR